MCYKKASEFDACVIYSLTQEGTDSCNSDCGISSLYTVWQSFYGFLQNSQIIAATVMLISLSLDCFTLVQKNKQFLGLFIGGGQKSCITHVGQVGWGLGYIGLDKLL